MMRRFSSPGWGLTGLVLALVNLAPIHAAPVPDQRAADKAERMAVWRRLRFGLFIHWGPYSELGGTYNGKAYQSNTEWIMRSAAISRTDYREAAKRFDPKAYDPAAIVSFAKDCGFKYIIMTAKHYDGFAMFDSKASDFNSVAVLPSKRDFLMEFSKACKAGDMPLGFSYTIDRDWYNPGGDTVGKAWDTTQLGSRSDYLQEVALPQLHELMANYGPVFTLLTDDSRVIPAELTQAFKQAVPPQVVMPRDFEGNNDYSYTDGVGQGHSITQTDWEQCNTLGDSWGYRRGATEWKSADSILRQLVTTVGRGGNYLLNVGLDGDGKVPDAARERLEKVGGWLSQYGEAIYGTSKSPFLTHPWQGEATVLNQGEKGCALYLFLFGKDKRPSISLPSLLTEPQSAEVMGTGQKLTVRGMAGHWELETSGVDLRQDITVLKIRLPGPPAVGPGPVLASGSGRINLPLSQGTYADRRTELTRTPESAELQLTGFRDSQESGSWQIYSESTTKVRLNLKSITALPVDGKSLSIWLNDRKVGEAQIKSAGSPADIPTVLESASFRLPAGASQLRISGNEEEKNPLSISISEIALIPSN